MAMSPLSATPGGGHMTAARTRLNRMGLHHESRPEIFRRAAFRRPHPVPGRRRLIPYWARRNSAATWGLGGREITVLALMISFPVIGLDQFLRATSGNLSAQPYVQAGQWLTDSLIALPLFAIGVWAGDRIAALAGLGGARRADVLKRAVLVTLLAALAQVPAWFLINKSDDPVTAQPLIAPQAHDSGDVYWVAPWVIIALVCVCLAPAAIWAASAIGRGITGRAAVRSPGARPPRARPAVAHAVLLVPLLAVAVLLAWALHQAASRAYASQVYYTSAPPVVSHVLAAARQARRPAGSLVTAAPFAFIYQAAHALQDGLAGQAAGLPVAVIALLRFSRGMDSRNQHQPTDT